MKSLLTLILVVLLCCTTGLSAYVAEVAAVDRLIGVTEQKLEAQKKLKDLMVAFEVHKERFSKGEQSKEHALRMVKSARQILEVITAEHMQHLFSSEYMDELVMFSSIAGKTTCARP